MQEMTELEEHNFDLAMGMWMPGHATPSELAGEIPTLADLEFPCCFQIGEHAHGCPGRLMI